ncbi:MAG: ribonuclease HII [Candidatus Margulisbacteria bacterium]|nr:ribonuclease HII [Candidatus Margulisiibacteriota bacterium]
MAGVDEAGRGALAGPVVAASVVLDPALPPDLFSDSKQLTAARREALFAILETSESYIGVGVHSAFYVDQKNILKATLSAMRHSILSLNYKPNEVLIDGNKIPTLPGFTMRAIVHGDRLIPAISAASIVAKVLRDRMMDCLDKKFPAYGFKIHKGYGTSLHYEALFVHGISDVHRKTFNLHRQQSLF